MLQTEKNKKLQLLIHVIGWGMIFAFPFFFISKSGTLPTWEAYLGYVFVPVGFMIVFYINYFFLIENILFRRKVTEFILLNILLIGGLLFLLDLWRDFYILHISHEVHKSGPRPPKLLFISRDFMVMGLTAGLSVAIKMTQNWYKVQNEKKELEKARSEAELQNLKNQLNPHFLFNTLNNIYSLIAINSERAQYAVHDLSKLLRYVLYESNQKSVLFNHELVFMKSYIELMGLRLSDKVKLTINIPEEGGDFFIAPLLFITLIENAFKHGVNPGEHSFITVNIEIRPNQMVYCRIENSYFPKKENDHSGSGIGLDNLHKRLELLYAGHYMFNSDLKDGRYVTELVINPV